MNVIKLKDFKESLISLILCTFGDLISGMVMGSHSKELVILPALIVLIPASTDLRGNIYGSLGSRLSTYLHTGRIKPKFESNPTVAENIYSSTFLLLSFSVFNGFAAAVISSAIGLHPLTLDLTVDLILITVISAFLSALFMIPTTLALAICSYRWGWDPDNLTAPLITLAGDMITLPILFASADVVFELSRRVKFASIFMIAFALLYFYRLSRGDLACRIIRESVPILIACAVIDFGSGTILGKEVEGLIATAGILTIIPAFLEDGGAMGGILASRFSSGLHLGSLEPKIVPDRSVIKSFAVMHALSLIVFTLVGFFGQVVNRTLSIPTIPTVYMVAITVVAGQMLTVLLNLMAYYFSILSFAKGIDPDNVGIPLITSLMDVLGTGCLVASLKIFKVV